jgi:branched-chain amino acid transport system substrate-binding protein
MSLRLTLLAAVAAMAMGAAAAHADITIAVAGPITGEYASFGTQMQHGAEMAVKDINAAGGVLGQKLVLKVGDDACDPKQAVAVANGFVEQGVKFVAGHFCSGSSIPASKVYSEEGILQITPASTNPKLTEQGLKNVFRTCGRDDQQGAVAGKLLAEHDKGKKIAILHDNSPYGKGLAEETQKALHAGGGKEVIFDTITPGEKDYSAVVSKLKSAGIEVVYLGGYHPEAGLIVRQMRDQGMKTQLVSGDALVTQEFWSITGPAGEGTIMTFPPDPRGLPEAAKVVKEFQDSGFDPEGYTLYTYAAVQVWKDAAEKAKSTALDKVAAALHANSFNTVIGKLGFDSKGDITSNAYVWYVWKDGKYGEAKL